MAEKKAYEADTGELDLDMGEHEAAEVEIDDPSNDNEEPRSAQSDQSDDEGGSEHDDVMNSAQKRINRLTKKMRDAERQREEALRYAQQVQSEAEQLKSRMKQLDSGYLQEYGSRLDIETKTAEAELKRAVELGDSEKIISSQRRLNELYSAGQKYRDAKRLQQTQEQQYAQQQQYIQQQQAYAAQQPAQQQVRRPDPKAEDWAERNPWFGQDEALTFAAFGVHKKLVEDEGFDPQSDEYYNELDRRLQKRFGDQMPRSEDTASNSGSGRRPAQTVAGVSRSKSNGRKKVRLTPTQVAIAKKLGVPLDEYAKYVKE